MIDNSIDILYYDQMIENAIEDRKIQEAIFECNYNCIVNENTEIAIYEANVFETILNAIKKLIDRVIEFVKGLIEKITGKLFFTPNKKLIRDCMEKIKSMTKEEKDQVNMKSIDMIKDVNKRIEWSDKQYIIVFQKFQEAVAHTNRFLGNKDKKNTMFNLSDDQLDRTKEGIVTLNAAIDKLSNIEDMRNNANDIKFNDIIKILDEYKDDKGADSIKVLNSKCNKIVGEMRHAQQTMNRWVNDNRFEIIRAYDQKELSKYRDLIHFLSGAVINICKFEFNMNVLIFRNKEAILRRFVNTTDFNNTDKTVNPNFKMLAAAESTEDIEDYFEYEDEAINELALFLPDDLKKLRNDLKASCKEFNKAESDKLKEKKKDKNLVGKLAANYNYNTKSNPKAYDEIKNIMKKHGVEMLGSTVYTTYYNNVPTTNEHVITGIYKDYVLSLKVLQAYGAPSISMGGISIKYDPKKCSIPKNVVLDVISSMGVIDAVSSGKNSIKVSPKNLYYIKTELPKLEKKYSDEYDVKKNFGGFSITLSKKK